MDEVTEIRIRYRGKFIGGKWMYNGPRIVDLPIPFLSRSAKEGEVLCDPVGTFPTEYGLKLLELSGKDGPFVLEEGIFSPSDETIRPDASPVTDASPLPRGEYTPSRMYRRYRMKKRQGNSGRPGISRPFPKKKEASLPDNPQADVQQLAPTPA